MMDNKQKLQNEELEQAAGGANGQVRAKYCQNCRAYRENRGEFISVDDGCTRTYRCAVCGTTLIVK